MVWLVASSSRGSYPPADQYVNYAGTSNMNLVESFKSMQIDEYDVPLENGDTAHEVHSACVMVA